MTYTIVRTPDPEQGGYVVTVPALPDAITYGATVEEAIAMAEDVIRSLLTAYEQAGQPVEPPEPPIIATVAIA
jgi:antitoxin HicB